MAKNVGLTYVKDFTFPSEQGFTGSAGKNSVKGYQRGGRVRKMGEGGKFGKPGDKYPKLKSGPAGKRSAMPKGVKAKGGRVNKQMGGYMGPEREIAVDDVKITVPKNRGGSVHDKLKHEGAKMGYAYGGQVKDTSGEFKAKRGKQDTMDHGVQPAQKGNNEAEVEAGGNKRLKAGYKKGGVIQTSYREKVAKMKGRASDRDIESLKAPDRTKGKGKSKAGFPATVKARGGPATTPGKAKAMGLHKSAARRAPGTTRSAKGGLARYAHGGKGRKPYTGYNKQPGGSGNEDKRYMK